MFKIHYKVQDKIQAKIYLGGSLFNPICAEILQSSVEKGEKSGGYEHIVHKDQTLTGISPICTVYVWFSVSRSHQWPEVLDEDKCRQ